MRLLLSLFINGTYILHYTLTLNLILPHLTAGKAQHTYTCYGCCVALARYLTWKTAGSWQGIAYLIRVMDAVWHWQGTSPGRQLATYLTWKTALVALVILFLSKIME